MATETGPGSAVGEGVADVAGKHGGSGDGVGEVDGGDAAALLEAVSAEGVRVGVFTDRLETAYELGKPIGKGKFSTVYKAIRRSDGVPVAMKQVAIFDIMDARSREKCLKEIRLVQSLDHDNIIRYLDGFIQDKQLILVFEYAEAGDLKRQIRKAKEREARFDERVIWRYFAQIAGAVAHMHSKRIMHRDLKPANIFLTLNGTVKVGDLGLGRLLSEHTMEAHSKVGTPLYMSPEVLKGKGYEWKSDVWSLGCILYELAMLRSQFKEEGLNLYGLFQKITSGVVPPISDVYSDDLANLVAAMLSQEPADRPDVEEVYHVACAQRDKLQAAKAKALATAAPAAAPAPAPAGTPSGNGAPGDGAAAAKLPIAAPFMASTVQEGLPGAGVEAQRVSPLPTATTPASGDAVAVNAAPPATPALTAVTHATAPTPSWDGPHAPPWHAAPSSPSTTGAVDVAKPRPASARRMRCDPVPPDAAAPSAVTPSALAGRGAHAPAPSIAGDVTAGRGGGGGGDAEVKEGDGDWGSQAVSHRYDVTHGTAPGTGIIPATATSGLNGGGGLRARMTQIDFTSGGDGVGGLDALYVRTDMGDGGGAGLGFLSPPGAPNGLPSPSPPSSPHHGAGDTPIPFTVIMEMAAKVVAERQGHANMGEGLASGGATTPTTTASGDAPGGGTTSFRPVSGHRAMGGGVIPRGIDGASASGIVMSGRRRVPSAGAEGGLAPSLPVSTAAAVLSPPAPAPAPIQRQNSGGGTTAPLRPPRPAPVGASATSTPAPTPRSAAAGVNHAPSPLSSSSPPSTGAFMLPGQGQQNEGPPSTASAPQGHPTPAAPVPATDAATLLDLCTAFPPAANGLLVDLWLGQHVLDAVPPHPTDTAASTRDWTPSRYADFTARVTNRLYFALPAPRDALTQLCDVLLMGSMVLRVGSTGLDGPPAHASPLAAVLHRAATALTTSSSAPLSVVTEVLDAIRRTWPVAPLPMAAGGAASTHAQPAPLIVSTLHAMHASPLVQGHGTTVLHLLTCLTVVAMPKCFRLVTGRAASLGGGHLTDDDDNDAALEEEVEEDDDEEGDLLHGSGDDVVVGTDDDDGGGPGVLTPAQPVVGDGVDAAIGAAASFAAEWQRECTRVAGALTSLDRALAARVTGQRVDPGAGIGVPAGSSPPTSSTWQAHLTAATTATVALGSMRPTASTMLTGLAEGAAASVSAIRRGERYLASGDAARGGLLQEHERTKAVEAALTARCAELAGAVERHASTLADVEEELAAAQEELDAKTVGLATTTPLQQIRASLVAVRRESLELHVQAGVLQARLLRAQAGGAPSHRQRGGGGGGSGDSDAASASWSDGEV